jgi:hypothetical protein
MPPRGFLEFRRLGGIAVETEQWESRRLRRVRVAVMK